MLGSASHSQHTHWGSSDGVAYIHTTPLLQGKPISEPHMSANQPGPRSPFEAPSVQAQPPLLLENQQQQQLQQDQHHLQQQQQQQQQPHQHHHHRQQSGQHQLPMIMEQTSNQSISPSDTNQYSGTSPTTSSCSSPSASTAADASSTDLRAFPDGSVEGPLHLQPITPQYPMQGNAPFQGGHDSQDASSSQQQAGTDYRLGTGGLNKSRYRGVSYDKKKRKWRVQIKVSGTSAILRGEYSLADATVHVGDVHTAVFQVISLLCMQRLATGSCTHEQST